jgi:hypothetical protein
MTRRTTRRTFGLGAAAVLTVAGAAYGITRPANAAHAPSHTATQHTYVVLSCEEVGAWCGDAERAAQKHASARTTLTASCASVGAWCADAERNALKTLNASRTGR